MIMALLTSSKSSSVAIRNYWRPPIRLMLSQVPTPPSRPLRSYEGTTVLAVVYNAGVVMAGDRQATEGYQVGERRIQKVYPVDRHSAIAVAGAAGPCIEMAKLFQVEVEFYEKTEGMRPQS